MTEQKESNLVAERIPTVGEKLAGVSFNPSKSPSVDDVKYTAAKFIDAINKAENRFTEQNSIQLSLFQAAYLRALEAQMLAVKAITWNN